MNYELIQYATSAPEWVTEGWVIAIFAVVAVFVVVFCIAKAVDSWGEDRTLYVFGAIAGPLLIFMVYGMMYALISEDHVPYEEKARVAVEVSEVSEQDVSVSEVESMLAGDFVPKVNYDRMTDSNGDTFLKVEVG